jgi:two-component system sensor histidine kinase DesK
MTAGMQWVDHGRTPRQIGRRWRRYSGLFLVYLLFGLGDLFDRNGSAGIAVGLALLGVFIGLYLVLLPIGLSGNQRAARWVTPAMLAIFAAYSFVGGPDSPMLLIYVAVGVVALHPLRVSSPVVAALCATSLWLPPRIDSWNSPGVHWGYAASIAVVSLVVYGARRNEISQIALLKARLDLERMTSIEQERLRISRDLHDLLGHTLTTVAVKAELAQRLVSIDPTRATDEMREVAALARQSLTDVRSTVAGYREVSLPTELATAREVLRAAGIEADLPPTVASVPEDQRELFGWVVREGVTNAVRHSRAHRVTIRILDRGIEVVDDGARPAAYAGNDTCNGTGLQGLAERVAAAGGQLTAGAADCGGWRLAVEM